MKKTKVKKGFIMKKEYALVLGAGAFGTSIASILAENFKTVILKVRSKDVYESLLEHENKIYLPGLKLSNNIVPIMDWSELEEKGIGVPDLIVSGLPTAAITGYCKENYDLLEGFLSNGTPFVSLSKGIDPETLELPDDLFFDLFPKHRDNFCFLSGPSFAKEIVQKQITLVSLAGRSKRILESVQEMFSTNYFKVFPTYDIKGVLLGGALKNILAIAGGVIEGLGFNYNTRAALITRGITEMLRFGQVFNARPETFYGLAGMGDLILTTTGTLSRNKSFGLELAKGRKASEIIASQRSVVEGYKTTKAAYLLAKKYDIRASIFSGVYDVLYNDVDPLEQIKKVMATPGRFEL